jgi:hypothetical protein
VLKLRAKHTTISVNLSQPEVPRSARPSPLPLPPMPRIRTIHPILPPAVLQTTAPPPGAEVRPEICRLRQKIGKTRAHQFGGAKAHAQSVNSSRAC